MSPLDPRSVANVVIGVAQEYGFSLTQLSLQKILYFIQGRHLTEVGRPLMSGFFEAWPYGPVHPLIYTSFKNFGTADIAAPATVKDLATGSVSIVPEPTDPHTRLFVRETAVRYLRLSPGRLVELSHAPKSPWDKATLSPEGERRFGMRIPNEDIRDLFKFHKISVGAKPRSGEPNEESLPTGN
jgi:uncharacterized phage-associated protein